MKFSEGTVHDYPVAANAVIRVGALVTVDANGYAIEMPVAANQRALGVATAHVDNTGGANGAKRVTVLKRGIVTATVSGGLNQTNIGSTVYGDGYDATLARPTVSGTATGRSAVGTLVSIAGTTAEIQLATV